MSSKDKVSIYLSYILRHRPDEIGVKMDKHGWVNVNHLLHQINHESKYHITMDELTDIVNKDKKGRYRFNDQKTMIKACQGHSIPWVEPELKIMKPPKYLYHGTNMKSYEKIMHSQGLEKMERHAVHMQADVDKAWQSADRWHQKSVVIEIDAEKMYQDGYEFGMADNGVWCTNNVPKQYFVKALYEKHHKKDAE